MTEFKSSSCPGVDSALSPAQTGRWRVRSSRRADRSARATSANRVFGAVALAVLLIVGLAIPTGCGGVSGGVIALIEGNDSDSVTVVFAELSFLDLRSASEAPAILEFRLTQPQSIAATIVCRYRDPKSGELRNCTLINATFLGEELTPSLMDLETAPAPEGVLHRKAWDFETDLGGAQVTGGLTLDLSVVDAGGNPVGDPAPSGGPISLGNDPPVLAPIAIAPPTSGVVLSGDVPFVLNVQDSSADPVAFYIEYAVVPDPLGPGGDVPADDPSLDWLPARPAGGEDEPAPSPTLGEVATAVPPSFAQVSFVWATRADLGATQPFVRLRVRAVETSADGAFAEQVTDPFLVDNNEPSEIVVSEGPLFLNPDRRGGIPIPFQLVDPESDPVRVYSQWTAAGEPFSAMPTTVDAIEALTDRERRDLGIGSVLPTRWTGRIDSTTVEGPTTLRLARLASAGLRAAGPGTDLFDEWSVEILRDKNSADAGVVTEVGSMDSLDPVDIAAWPNESSRWAIVTGESTWAVYSVASSDRSAQLLAAGQGTPQRIERDGDGWWVVVLDGNSIRGIRVSATGETTASFEASRPAELTEVFGFAIVNDSSGLVSGPGGVWRVALDVETAGVPDLWFAFDDPRGMAVDPQCKSRVWLADAAADAIRELDLTTFAVTTERRFEVTSPDELEFIEGGRRLVVSSVAAGERAVRVFDRVPLDLTVAGVAASSGLGIPLGVFEAGQGVVMRGDTRLRYAGGEDQALAIVIQPEAATAKVAFSGGVVERRRVLELDLASLRAELDTPFVTDLSIGRAWRLSNTRATFNGAPDGARHRLLWNSNEVSAGVDVDLRLVLFDLGSPDGTPDVVPLSSALSVASRLGAPVPVTPTGSYDFALTRDVTGDGRDDLIGVGGGSISIWTQVESVSTEVALSTPTVFDGDLPVACGSIATIGAESQGRTVLTFVQNNALYAVDAEAAAEGVAAPVLVADSVTIAAITIADLDGDGGGDIVVAGPGGVGVYLVSNGLVGPFNFVSLDDGLVDGTSVAVGRRSDDGTSELIVAVAEASGDTGSLRRYEIDVVEGAPVALPLVSLDLAIDGFQPTDVHWADLDGDGQSDVIAVGQRESDSSSSLLVYYGSATLDSGVMGSGVMGSGVIGSGMTGFDAPIEFGGAATLDRFARVSLADLDQDGDLDLIASDALHADPLFSDLRTVIFWQRAARMFDRSVVDQAFGFASVTDFDGDGFLDLISSQMVADEARIAISPGVGPGRFLAERQSVGPGTGGTTADLSPVTVSDLDSDGRLDVISSALNSSNRLVSWARQSSPGTFEPSLRGLPRPVPGAVANALAAADLNGDARDDLVVASETSIYVFWQPEGGFTETQAPDRTLSLGSATRITDLEIEDLNGDGVFDLAWASPDTGVLTIAYQDAAGEFGSFSGPTFVPGVWLEVSAATVVDLAIGDVTGDGTLDVVAAQAGLDRVTVFSQVNPETFVPVLVLQAGGFVPIEDFVAPRSIELCDLDSDGRLDVIVGTSGTRDDSAPGSSDGNRVIVFHQIGFGVFSPQVLGDDAQTAQVRAIQVIDVDRDGRPDLAVASHRGAQDLGLATGNVSVFYGRPGRRFSPRPDRILAVESPTSLVAADVDGDGFADLVTRSLLVNAIEVFFGDR